MQAGIGEIISFVYIFDMVSVGSLIKVQPGLSLSNDDTGVSCVSWGGKIYLGLN